MTEPDNNELSEEALEYVGSHEASLENVYRSSTS